MANCMTVDEVLERIRLVPGVRSAELGKIRVLISMPARDWFPVQRRVAAWLALCPGAPPVLWKLLNEEPSGAYDSMERAISTMT